MSEIEKYPPRGICRKGKQFQVEYGPGRTTQDLLEKTDPDFPIAVSITPRCKGYLRYESDRWADKLRERAGRGDAR